MSIPQQELITKFDKLNAEQQKQLLDHLDLLLLSSNEHNYSLKDLAGKLSDEDADMMTKAIQDARDESIEHD